MKLLIPNLPDNAATLFRRAGYVFQYEKSGEMSFVRPLARAGYPRFHCYVVSGPAGMVCNIHLDQKRETYGQVTRHHGEYVEEGALSDEVDRIESLVGSLTRIV